MELPLEFTRRMASIVPPDRLAAVLASFGADKALVVWSNPLRDPEGEALAALEGRGAKLTPLAYEPSERRPSRPAAVVSGLPREAVTQGPEVESGALYVINPSSLLPPAALAPEPGETVLDLCAAPGGKSIQLAARLFASGEAGHLAAVEAVKPRFFKLQALLARYGAPRDPARVRLFLKDGRTVGGAVPERFDRVLIDAPCSSEARFDPTDPDSMAHWTPRKLAECAHKQRGLLESGLQALKVGGTLVYSTCSFATEENEEVVLDVLARLEGSVVAEAVQWAPEVPTMPGLLGLGEARRVLPDALWDGFFLVKLRKIDHGPQGPPEKPSRDGREGHDARRTRGRGR
jgi:16S rRNA (cytosine1407-C5)-methyltransferase